MESVDNRISQHLQCSLCLGQFNDPRTLPCLHTFCLSCLEEVASGLGRASSCMRCPVCRKQHPWKEPRDLPVNFLINSLLGALTLPTMTRNNNQEKNDTSQPVEVLLEQAKGFVSLIKVALNELEDSVETVNNEAMKTKEAINACFEHRLKALEARRAELLRELEANRKEAIDALQGEKVTLENTMALAHTDIEFAERSHGLNSGKNGALKCLSQKRLKDLNEEEGQKVLGSIPQPTLFPLYFDEGLMTLFDTKLDSFGSLVTKQPPSNNSGPKDHNQHQTLQETPQNQTFRVFVRFKSKTLTMTVSNDTSVQQLKELLRRILKHLSLGPNIIFILLYAGKFMQGNHTLTFYGVSKDASIDMRLI